jgi:hypothetical protein
MSWIDQFEQHPAYRWLWTRIGGRPWTHLIRDWCRAHTLAYSAVVLAIGYALALAPSTLALLAAVVILSLVFGHLWV